MMANKVPSLKMNNGRTIPIFGLGTWKSKPGEVEHSVKVAIDVGYRHFDCAYLYLNEDEIGNALQKKMQEGVVRREDLFVTSKLWNTFHNPQDVIPLLKESLQNLKLDYLDLYLIHFPLSFKKPVDYKTNFFPEGPDKKVIYSNDDYVDTWKAMEEAYHQGLAKSIGLSNFNSQQINRILANCKVVPAMNQVESHPYLNQKKLINFCREKGILVTAYSPLGCGDNPWKKGDEPVVLNEPQLKEIGNKYGKSPAQVLIRYQIDRGVVVIPKSVNPVRIKQNIDVFDFKLTKEDIDVIDSFETKTRYRYVNLNWVKDHPYYPYDLEF